MIQKHRSPLANTFEASGLVLTLRRGSDAAGSLSKAERDEMLAEVRGNPATTARLTLVADTYLQGARGMKPNAKCVRVRDGALRALARSFKNTPFLRDHDAYDFMARGGTVVGCELVDLEDGTKALRQTLELVKPWAVEAALDGTLDRFSVAFRCTGSVTCTICDQEYERGWFGMYSACEHERGVEYDIAGGGKAVCEAEYSDAEGVECSAVSVPAVQGTTINEIRAAFAHVGELTEDDRAVLREAVKSFGRDGGAIQIPELYAALAAGRDPNQENSIMKFATIAAALGLAAAAEETAIVAEISTRDAQLAAARTRAADAEARLAQREEQLATGRRAELSARALREGKVRPGSELAAKIDQLALASIEAAEAFVNELPRVTPVGAGLASNAAEPKAGQAAAQAGGVSLTAEETEVLRQLNAGGAQLTAEEFLASKRSPALAVPNTNKAGAAA